MIINWSSRYVCAMFTRRKSIDENQTVLSGYVSKQEKTDKKKNTGKTLVHQGQQTRAHLVHQVQLQRRKDIDP